MKSFGKALAAQRLAYLVVLVLVACGKMDGSGANSFAGAGGMGVVAGGATNTTGGATIAASGSAKATGGTSAGANGTATASGGTAVATGGKTTVIGGTTNATGGTSGASSGSNTTSAGATNVVGGTNSAFGGRATATGAATNAVGGKPTVAGGASTSAAGTDVGAAGKGGGTFTATPKPRVLVLTDISNEPDDEESLVRFLVYSNEYDVEGLVATTSTHLKTGPREDLIRAQLDAYAQVRSNLLQHAAGFPTADALRAVTATGQTAYGMAAVGLGKSTVGSKLIVDAVDKADERPLWIAGWCGMNTLAQALTDVRNSRTKAEVDRFVSQLRVYSISDQDDAGSWLRSEFPNLFYIVSPSDQTAEDYYLATWTGISGDEHYSNGPGYRLDVVANSWLATNVGGSHGPLGKLYPQWKYIMEGDTPSFIGLIDNGLGSSISPSYGGWGGRYALSNPSGESRRIWTNSSDSFEYEPGATNTSNQATIWRWRPDYQYDFAARMDWCVANSFEQANHNPVPALNGDLTKHVMTISASSGTTLGLSAVGTSDPDGDSVSVRWRIYSEAGTLASKATLSTSQGLTTDVSLPKGKNGTLHVILDARDNGEPQLSAYRRVIIDIVP